MVSLPFLYRPVNTPERPLIDVIFEFSDYFFMHVNESSVCSSACMLICLELPLEGQINNGI